MTQCLRYLVQMLFPKLVKFSILFAVLVEVLSLSEQRGTGLYSQAEGASLAHSEKA